MCTERRKKILTFIRFSIPMFGFLFICLAAFLLSMSNGSGFEGHLILAYCLMTLGFFMLLLGISWSMYRGANHKLFLRRVLRYPVPDRREFHLSTVNRPDFYPPSYEESIGEPSSPIFVFGCTTIGIEQRVNIPPPLYTEHSAESISGPYTDGELPPLYEESAQQPSILREPLPPQ